MSRDLVPPPPETATSFPVLDTLRAVGALCVVTTHAAFWSGAYTQHGAWGTLLSRLDVGVALFFVLSGFLLARPYLAAARDGRPAPGTPHYLWKRFLRIAPVYVITVVLALSLIDANAGLGVGDWVRTLLMADTFVAPHFPAGLTHMWSLAAEVTFYLLLPLLMAVAVGGRRQRPRRFQPPRVAATLVVLLGITVWWHLDGAARFDSWGPGAPLLWLPAYLSWFALGIGLALVQLLHETGRWNRLTRPLVSMAGQPGSCWAVVAGLLLVAATPLAGPSMLGAPTPAESLTKNLIYAAIGALVVLTGVFPRPGGAYARAFSHPTARRLGWISYGVFCLHLPILHLVMWTTGWELFRGHLVPMWLITVALSLVAAELTYRFVERPSLRLKGFWPLAPTRHDSSSAGSSTPTKGTSIR